MTKINLTFVDNSIDYSISDYLWSSAILLNTEIKKNVFELLYSDAQNTQCRGGRFVCTVLSFYSIAQMITEIYVSHISDSSVNLLYNKNRKCSVPMGDNTLIPL